MTVKITGFADEIAPELTAQIAGLKGLECLMWRCVEWMEKI